MGSAAGTLLMIVAIGACAAGQPRKSAYAGEVQRQIKSLSAEEIEAYGNGDGMGFAKAAELNHYPGPRHVLDMAKEIGLTGEQKANTEKIYHDMHEEAVKVGKRIVEDEGKLDDLFSSGKIDQHQLDSVTAAISALQGRLRAIHLGAHLAERGVLSPEQIQKYDELRGYHEGKTLQHHDHMHH